MKLTAAGKLGLALIGGTIAIAVVGLAFLYNEIQRHEGSEVPTAPASAIASLETEVP